MGKVEKITDLKDTALGVDYLVVPVWDQQPGEKDEEYHMFLVYGKLPPGGRTVQAAWERWSGRDTKFSSTFNDKYRRWRWRERAEAWDAERIRETRDHWVSRDADRRDADFVLGKLFRDVAEMALDEIDYTELTPNQIARFAELGSKLQTESVPDLSMERDEVKALLETLDPSKKEAVVRLLMAEFTK